MNINITVIERLPNGTEFWRECINLCSQNCKGDSGYCDERFECGKCKIVEVTTDIWLCQVSNLCVDCCRCRDCQPETPPPPRRDTKALADLFPKR